MERYEGKSIFRKIAMGKIFFYEKNNSVVKRGRVSYLVDKNKDNLRFVR